MSSKPRWPGRRMAVFVLLGVLAATEPLAAAQTTSNTNGHPPSADSTPAAKPDSATTNAATSPRTPENNAALAEKIAKLPPLTGTGIDVPRRSAEILAHLNAVLRFYRAAVTPIQKAGEPSDVLYAQQSRAQATEITQLAQIQGQHQQVEAWIGTAVPEPRVESRLELAAGGLQFAVLFPVQIDNAAATDQQIAEDLVKAMQAEGPLKAGLPELPVIKAAVKT